MEQVDRRAMLKVEPPPVGCEIAYRELLTPEALVFLEKFVTEFSDPVQQLYTARAERQWRLRHSDVLPEFPVSSTAREDRNWRIAPLPAGLRERRIDLGDVSPANLDHFRDALLASGVHGIQVDFDDGHCPAWSTQLRGLHNVLLAARGRLPGVTKSLTELPLLVLRPRAWNMTEQHVMLMDRGIPGPLLDFGLLIFHLGRELLRAGRGPCFYLSKLEGAAEAELWNQIFVWTQLTLGLPQRSIKACVLIENILAVYECEEILHSLRDHSLGLNCGIWDYSASIIATLGHRPELVLPERSRLVSSEQGFLRAYMQHVMSTCHARDAPATGGMSPLVISHTTSEEEIKAVVAAKRREIEMGMDGFLIYDIKLTSYMQQIWASPPSPPPSVCVVRGSELLQVPTASSVSLDGVRRNIEVGVLFVVHWQQGVGHFQLRGAVEDSATAEISRAQLWQWAFHRTPIEGFKDQRVNHDLLRRLTEEVTTQLAQTHSFNLEELQFAGAILLDVVCAREPPPFLTTLLSDSHVCKLLASRSTDK